jgi:hypothetical protein
MWFYLQVKFANRVAFEENKELCFLSWHHVAYIAGVVHIPGMAVKV